MSIKTDKSLIMNANTNSRMINWQQMLASLPWSPKHAGRSAMLALSKAQWLGLDRDQAIQQVFETALGGFFRTNPHVPFEAWQTVSEQFAASEEGQAGLVNA